MNKPLRTSLIQPATYLHYRDGRIRIGGSTPIGLRQLQALHDMTDDDGDFSRGIHTLSGLCGLSYPAHEILMSAGMKTKTLKEITKGPNRSFQVKV